MGYDTQQSSSITSAGQSSETAVPLSRKKKKKNMEERGMRGGTEDFDDDAFSIERKSER